MARPIWLRRQTARKVSLGLAAAAKLSALANKLDQPISFLVIGLNDDGRNGPGRCLRIQLPGLVDYSTRPHRSNYDNALVSLFAEAVNTKGHTVEGLLQHDRTNFYGCRPMGMVSASGATCRTSWNVALGGPLSST
jgi:hypothetical protein